MKNKTLKRLTATFLTATSIFNFTVPGKAKVVNFQSDKSIRYGEENDNIINAEALEEIRGKIKEELNTIKLGNEFRSKLSDYNTDNFTTVFKRTAMHTKEPEKDKWLDKEFVFKYEDKNKGIKIYINVKSKVRIDGNKRILFERIAFNQLPTLGIILIE